MAAEEGTPEWWVEQGFLMDSGMHYDFTITDTQARKDCEKVLKHFGKLPPNFESLPLWKLNQIQRDQVWGGHGSLTRKLSGIQEELSHLIVSAMTEFEQAYSEETEFADFTPIEGWQRSLRRAWEKLREAQDAAERRDFEALAFIAYDLGQLRKEVWLRKFFEQKVVKDRKQDKGREKAVAKKIEEAKKLNLELRERFLDWLSKRPKCNKSISDLREEFAEFEETSTSRVWRATKDIKDPKPLTNKKR